jgi:hypothetical protein
MLQSGGSYFAYEPILKALQGMECLPMQELLLPPPTQAPGAWLIASLWPDRTLLWTALVCQQMRCMREVCGDDGSVGSGSVKPAAAVSYAEAQCGC